jgi:hypothetical protein
MRKILSNVQLPNEVEVFPGILNGAISFAVR